MSAAVLVALLAAAAQDDEEAAREAELFGEQTATTTVSPARTSTLATEASSEVEDTAPAEEPATALSRLSDALGVKNDTLQIGGDLWLWAQYAALDEGAPKTFRTSSPSFVDVYLDARPNDRVRGYLRGRLTHDLTVGPGTTNFLGAPAPQSQVLLDQLWVNFDLLRKVFVTAGRQRIRWGASRFWNPTDFLNQQRLDPLAFLDLRLGVGLLKLHLPLEDLGWNFYVIANVEGADRLDRVGGAARAELTFETAEITFSAAARKDTPLRLGGDISVGVWLFDLRLEAALLRGERRPFFEGSLLFPTVEQQMGPLEVDIVWPRVVSREDDWIGQVVIGAEITIPYWESDNLIIGAEYFYNGAGYGGDDVDLYPLLFATNNFTPLYVGTHYAGLYVLVMAPGTWNDTTFLMSGLGNLSDRSFIARFDYSVRVLTYLDVRAFASMNFGANGELNLGLDIPPQSNPNVPLEILQLFGDLDAAQASAASFTGGLRSSSPFGTLGAAIALRL